MQSNDLGTRSSTGGDERQGNETGDRRACEQVTALPPPDGGGKD